MVKVEGDVSYKSVAGGVLVNDGVFSYEGFLEERLRGFFRS